MISARPLGIALAAALAATLTISTASSQAAPVLSTGGALQSLQQRPSVQAAEQIQAVVDQAAYPGFAGITLADKEVTVWWKGTVPAAVNDVVKSAGRQAPVRVASAAYSKVELTAAAEKINAWRTANPDSGIHGVKNPGDGSGLVLATYPGVRAAAAVQSDVPVRIVAEEPMTAKSRKDDAPPWKGGAGTWNQTASTICTSGFGVRNGSGARYVLSAEHCGQTGHRIADRAGQFIGNVGPARDDHDISIIPTSSSTNQMYVGNGNSNTTVTVTNWGHVFVGQLLCQSGVTSAEATGGPVCNLKVIFFWQDAEDLVEAEQTQGQTAARGGDSGGSVYSVTTGGVIANGTVTRSAGARLGFQDFATANRDFGIFI